MRIVEQARAPVFRGRRRNTQRVQFGRLPPSQLLDASKPEVANQVFDPIRNYSHRRRQLAAAHLVRNGPQRRPVEMVHMCMGQQYRIDAGKVPHPDAGMPLTAQENEARRKDRVDEDRATRNLEQKRRVPDKGDDRLPGGSLDRLLRLALYRLRMALANETL